LRSRAFAASGIIGNLIGGSLADKYGPKKILLLGFLGLAVLLPIFCLVNNALIALLLLFPIGLILYASYSPSIVLGQNYLPNRVGLSSGITLGVAISIGGAATPIIGKIADIYGVWTGIVAVACLPMLIFSVAFGLPDPHSDDEAQKIVQPRDLRKSYYDKQKNTIGSRGYSSLERALLVVKLMSKR
jgi:FSR family fosmidomycin resistance protein-like MFS transporter